ncbi:hypothetical protein QBC36DRAFT_316209 [Triangularia setosa]|uniref:Uncharacterized protein n=1 Tax=Triangularia setosa TaxID=2587417 RepID=A0AAN6VX57_9PEZI|nr:hypothetical protein QBC36DRAFT_316209 [Podospora setosa]
MALSRGQTARPTPDAAACVIRKISDKLCKANKLKQFNISHAQLSQTARTRQDSSTARKSNRVSKPYTTSKSAALYSLLAHHTCEKPGPSVYTDEHSNGGGVSPITVDITTQLFSSASVQLDDVIRTIPTTPSSLPRATEKQTYSSIPAGEPPSWNNTLQTFQPQPTESVLINPDHFQTMIFNWEAFQYLAPSSLPELSTDPNLDQTLADWNLDWMATVNTNGAMLETTYTTE